MTTTPTEPAPTVEQIIHLPLDRLRPDPNNPRRHADGTALAPSIKAIGVQQPLVVRPANEDGVHLIVFGHRRHDGARQAGCATVPVVIRDQSDEDHMVAQLVENLGREDLDPVEEAVGYFRLVEMKMTQKTLAERVGVTARHVSNRLKLLQLPATALARVKTGELTVETALELVRFRDQPSVIEQALTEHNPVNAAERILRDQEATRLVAERTAELEAAGTAVASQPAAGWAHVVEDLGYSRGPGTIGFDKKGLKAHAKESCHVVVVRPARYYGSALVDETVYCSAPARHKAKGEAAVKTASVERAGGPERAAKVADNRSRREAAGSRLEFLMAKLASGKVPRLADSLILDVAIDGLLRVNNGFEGSVLATACRIAGMDLGVDRVPPSWATDHQDVRHAITSRLDGDASRRRLLFAAVLAHGHLDLANDNWSSDADRLWAALNEFGYVPHEWEEQRERRRQDARTDTATRRRAAELDELASVVETLVESGQLDPALADALQDAVEQHRTDEAPIPDVALELHTTISAAGVSDPDVLACFVPNPEPTTS